jgi:hypothetical protein
MKGTKMPCKNSSIKKRKLSFAEDITKLAEMSKSNVENELLFEKTYHTLLNNLSFMNYFKDEIKIWKNETDLERLDRKWNKHLEKLKNEIKKERK